MKTLFFIYSYFIAPLLYFGMKVLSLFDSKIKDGIKGRKKIIENLILILSSQKQKKKAICFHASSMGEFEQAKPIIEELKSSKKDYLIAATFFSPSGYKNNRNYTYIDIISYIPFDMPRQTNLFVRTLNPDVFIFMRYDIWPNLILALKKNKSKIFLVDATMKSTSRRFRPIVKQFHKFIFSQFDKILTISEEDKNNFLKFGIDKHKLHVVGDTRFDRVYKKSLSAKEIRLFNESIFKDKLTIVAGSLWEEDENILLPVIVKLFKYNSNLLFILVPHEPTERNLENLERKIPTNLRHIRFSQMINYTNENIIIIDSIGILLTLYKYANIAFVGGGFKYNVHNVLEPAAYGLPVIYGPKIKKSQEAEKLASLGGGFIAANQKELYKTLKKLIDNEDFRKRASEISRSLVVNNIGATQKIIKLLEL